MHHTPRLDVLLFRMASWPQSRSCRVALDSIVAHNVVDCTVVSTVLVQKLARASIYSTGGGGVLWALGVVWAGSASCCCSSRSSRPAFRSGPVSPPPVSFYSTVSILARASQTRRRRSRGMRGPIAQGAHDIVRLIGKKVVGGGEVARSGKLSRAERKGAGAAETARADRECKAGLGVVGSVLFLIVACFALQASGGGGSGQSIEFMRQPSQETLRAILFGASPVVIECFTPMASGQSLLREAAAASMMPEGLRVLSIECDAPVTAAGTSLLDRFKLPPPQPTDPPLLLQAGNGLRSPVPVGRHQSVASLVRHLKRSTQLHMAQLNSTLDLHRHCLSRPTCFVLMSAGTPSSAARAAVVRAIGTKQRELSAATLNRKSHLASFAAQLPASSSARAVLIALRATPERGPLTAEARAFRGVVSADNKLDLEAFVSTCATGTGGFTRLEALPKVVPKHGSGSGSGSAAGEAMAEEERYDPLLSQKRYERETAL